jgi:hypothetical protein
MTGRSKRWAVIGLAASAVVLLGLVAFGPLARAQAPETTPGQPSEGADGEGPDGDGHRWGRGWHHGGREGFRGADPAEVREFRADLAADLGEELGTPAAEVEAALRGLVSERLEEAVAAGRIDRAEADEALAAYDDGDLRRMFAVFHPHE